MMLRLRPYRRSDAAHIVKWADTERIHALWCGSQLQYPAVEEEFQRKLEENELKWNQCAFMVTKRDGTPIGSFQIGVNIKESSGFVSMVILEPAERGKGYGRQMIGLLREYAFTSAGLESLRLIVFDCNAAAVETYRRAGFVETERVLQAFSFGEERWGRIFMELKKGNIK